MKTWLQLAGAVVACLALGLLLSWALFVFWLHAPASHTSAALRYFVVSGLVSMVIGVAVLLAIVYTLPRLGLKIAVAVLLGSAAAIVNVVVTPLLMFSERSDFEILVITLLYFVAISLAFALIVGAVTTRQLTALHEGAGRVASGELGTRVGVQGTDEVADLANAFNRMADELGRTFARREQDEASRRDLIAAVSHDLRTPITSIRATAEAINDGVVTDPQTVRRYLRVIQQESERLGELIDDLFELSRIESGSLELRLAPVPFADLVAETVESLRIQAEEKDIALRVACTDEVPRLSIDGPRMQRVLVNLIENAIRYTPEGGRVDVSVRKDNGHVEVEVADSGEGVAPEDRERIFDQFYRSEKSRSRNGGGAGLGLTIARGIVEAHRGHLRLDTTSVGGARFVVTLGVS